MSLPRYRYTHNGQTGLLLIGNDEEAYLFQTDGGTTYPLSLDDLILIDTPETAFLAEVDALVGAWKNLCQSVIYLPNPDLGQRTLRECLDVMRQAINSQGEPRTAH